jgi:hypothetical protein
MGKMEAKADNSENRENKKSNGGEERKWGEGV